MVIYLTPVLLKNQITHNFYQLDLMTPGNSPFDANILKQILHIPNFLRNALLLPQMGHLL